jgi:hypothetical protein
MYLLRLTVLGFEFRAFVVLARQMFCHLTHPHSPLCFFSKSGNIDFFFFFFELMGLELGFAAAKQALYCLRYATSLKHVLRNNILNDHYMLGSPLYPEYIKSRILEEIQ